MLTSEEKKKILAFKGEGYSDYRIAKEMGLDVKTVKRYSEDEINSLESPNDSHGDFSEKDRKPILGKRASLSLGPVSSRKEDEYRASLIDFKMERLNDERDEYRERRDREKKEKLEAERIQRFDEFQVREEQRQIEERQEKIRRVKQRLMDKLYPDVMPHLTFTQRGRLIMELEDALSKLDILTTPEQALLSVAHGLVWKILDEAKAERDRLDQDRAERERREADALMKLTLKAVRIGAGLPPDEDKSNDKKVN